MLTLGVVKDTLEPDTPFLLSQLSRVDNVLLGKIIAMHWKGICNERQTKLYLRSFDDPPLPRLNAPSLSKSPLWLLSSSCLSKISWGFDPLFVFWHVWNHFIEGFYQLDKKMFLQTIMAYDWYIFKWHPVEKSYLFYTMSSHVLVCRGTSRSATSASDSWSAVSAANRRSATCASNACVVERGDPT